ncbi:ArsC family reductase [Dyadobacter tibetensis]|uniref:ArsC family reductase n=1 Tax=Dyadobacter tibetensis TaxID=1211851 RepID=UPI000472C600|nr:ArsC family reductase [Dyadobacter tibetensis]
MLTIYAIPNCNTVKKARQWLDAKGIEYIFHDYKKKGISEEIIAQWMDQLPWQDLINKAGTTWKRLSDEEKTEVLGPQQATSLMIAKTSVIKRPLIQDEEGKIVALGFSEENYQRIFDR